MNNTTKFHKKFIYPKDFKGYFQCDGFEGYEAAFNTQDGVQLVNCMSHIRRHFEQALTENKAMAEHPLKEIQLLYRIEHDCNENGYNVERRLKEQKTPSAQSLWAERTTCSVATMKQQKI